VAPFGVFRAIFINRSILYTTSVSGDSCQQAFGFLLNSALQATVTMMVGQLKVQSTTCYLVLVKLLHIAKVPVT